MVRHGMITTSARHLREPHQCHTNSAWVVGENLPAALISCDSVRGQTTTTQAKMVSNAARKSGSRNSWLMLPSAVIAQHGSDIGGSSRRRGCTQNPPASFQTADGGSS